MPKGKGARPEQWEVEYRKVKREDQKHVELAEKRMGKTPTHLLRWVAEFAQADLTSKRPEELVALGYDLRMLPWLVKDPIAGVARSWTRSLGPMPEAMLRAVHAKIAEGLRALTSGGPWPIPGAKDLLVYRSSPEGAAQTRFLAMWAAPQSEEEAILSAVARLVLEHGAKLRACPECGKAFVATRRQRYCDLRCSQRVRNQRRKEAEAITRL